MSLPGTDERKTSKDLLVNSHVLFNFIFIFVPYANLVGPAAGSALLMDWRKEIERLIMESYSAPDKALELSFGTVSSWSLAVAVAVAVVIYRHRCRVFCDLQIMKSEYMSTFLLINLKNKGTSNLTTEI